MYLHRKLRCVRKKSLPVYFSNGRRIKELLKDILLFDILQNNIFFVSGA